jgi:PhnB protein
VDKANKLSRRSFVTSVFASAVLVAMPECPVAETEIQPAGGNKVTTLTSYLLFDGNCQQAMEFYKSCFGGELSLTKVEDTPAKDHMPPTQLHKTINAHLKSGNLEISASDWLRPDRTPIRGNTVCLYLSGGTFQELKTLFQKLSLDAEVTDPLKEMFFGMYGALNDKFGVRWMFHVNHEV